MSLRRPSARESIKTALLGQPQLTLARLIIFLEAALRSFARPLFFAGVFTALAWAGLFARLYPYAHLLCLAFFIALFFDALGKASHLWKPPPSSAAKRRVEEASGLPHRPLDVIEDRAATIESGSKRLWSQHLLRAQEQTKDLRWPRLKIDFATYDPFHLRYALIALLALGLIAGWGALGGRMIAAINPALGKLPRATPPLDAWITPPAYTHLPPIMIATPAGDRFQDQAITVPEGSVLHAHLAEKDGDVPALHANNQSTEFVAHEGEDFEVAQPLNSGETIAIRRDWRTLGSWKIRIVPDAAPHVGFTETPSASQHKDVRIAYEAKDDYGVTSISLRMTPRSSLPGFDNDPMDFPLATIDSKDVKRVDFKDLTSDPRAGLPVDVQLIATDAVGHTSVSDKVEITLPEREFSQPVARALIAERKKLLQNIFDPGVRNETANLMASIAHQPESFGRDAVVMMALRAGAVRLVLGHDQDAALSVKDILWQTATRIESGMLDKAEENLKQAQQDLADALDRNAGEGEIQAKIDRLHQALAHYLAQLSVRMAAQPQQPENLGQLLGARSNALTPQDLEKILNDMKSLSASGARDQARNELSKLQQILENLQTRAPQLSKEQQASLELLKDLHALTRDQQQLLDATFQKSQSSQQESEKLAAAQKSLQERLQKLIDKASNIQPLNHSADAMARAAKSLKEGKADQAVAPQNEALQALKQAEEAIAADAKLSLFGLPQPVGSGDDPFGREDGSAISNDSNGVKLPDHMQAQRAREILNEIQRRAGDMNRTKTERDYIDRLLRNF